MGCCCPCGDSEDEDVLDFQQFLNAKVRSNGRRKIPSIIPEEDSKAGTSHGDESLIPNSLSKRMDQEDDFLHR